MFASYFVFGALNMCFIEHALLISMSFESCFYVYLLHVCDGEREGEGKTMRWVITS